MGHLQKPIYMFMSRVKWQLNKWHQNNESKFRESDKAVNMCSIIEGTFNI